VKQKKNRETEAGKMTSDAVSESQSPLDFSSEELAVQLTLIDLEIFKKIHPDELTSCCWNKKNKKEVSPNVVKFTQRFNHVSFWVIEEILKPIHKEDRVKILNHFIHVAKKCHEHNNLHTEYAIISALQSAPLFRLKKTWSLLSRRDKQTFDRLYESFSEEANFEELRKHVDQLAFSPVKDCIPYLGIYLTDLTYIDMAHPHTGGLESNQRRVKMNNILRIISELQESNYDYLVKDVECQKYLRSLRYIEELQKFVEDNQWKRSLAIEPNQLKPDQQDPKDHPEVMNHLNLSPSKIHINRVAGTDGIANSRPFVPGHRRAKSDGCGMFLMSSKSKHEVVQDNYKANYSHHLLDDSKLDEEPTYSRPTSPHFTLSADLRSSLRKGTLDKKNPTEGGVMKILRNPGIKCQHQGLIKRRSLIKDGNRPIITIWRRYWMQIWGDALVLYAAKLFAQGESRDTFRNDPCKYVTITGWHILVDVNRVQGDLDKQSSCSAKQSCLDKQMGLDDQMFGKTDDLFICCPESLNREFSFQLTDPIRRNVYQFRTECVEETNLWLHHLNLAVNSNDISKRSSKNLMSFD